MREIINITSIKNEKVKYFLSLQDKKTRNKEQRFIVEGYHLVEEASKTNLLEAIITTDKVNFNKFKDIEKYLVTMPIIEKLSTTKNPQNILGIVKVMDHSSKLLTDILLKERVRLLLLDEINDPGNLGTIIRTAAALGFDGIVMSDDTVDIYNEKVIRATQGVLFKIPIIKGNLIEVIKLLKKNKVKCFGTSLNKASFIDDIKSNAKMAFCVGNEARGVSKEVLDLMNENIKIKMNNDVESLNVGVAATIIMYEFSK